MKRKLKKNWKRLSLAGEELDWVQFWGIAMFANWVQVELDF